MADLAMSSGAAGKVLGPRPGKAACSFKEGKIEIILRIVNGAVAILPLIAGILIVAFTAVTNTNDQPASIVTSDNSSSEPVAYAAGALSLVTGSLVILWVIVMLILRLLNIGLLNLGSKYFLSVDVVINIILAIILVADGVISIIAAIEWTDSDVCVFGSAIFSVIVCFSSAVMSIVLVVYIIIYMIKDWNQEIVKYTIKQAITG